MVLHVGRTPDGRRGLQEIAVLRRGPDGLVHAVAAWSRDQGTAGAAAELEELLRSRR